MSAKKFSAGLGIVLLICAVVGIFVVIFGTETKTNSSSSSQRIEESITVIREKGRPTETTKRQRVHEPIENHKEKKGGLNEMERILWNDQRKRDSKGSRDEKTTTTTAPLPTSTEKPRQVNEKYGVAVERPKILDIVESPEKDGEEGRRVESSQDKKISSQMSWNEFSPSPGWNPSWSSPPTPTPTRNPAIRSDTNREPKVNLRTELNRRILASGESLRVEGSSFKPKPTTTIPSTHTQDVDLDIDHRQSHLDVDHRNHRPLPLYHHQSGGKVYGFEEEPDPGSQEQVSEEDQYVLHGSAEGEPDGDEEGEQDGQILPGIDVGQLFDLATNLYTSGTTSNASDLQEVLRVINETMTKGNNSGLLSRLTDLYSKLDTMILPGNSNGLGRTGNAYETSLTAFVFMSFGIFLLNQIHNFIDKENPTGLGREGGKSHRGGMGVGVGARNFENVNSLHDQGDAESNLEILFKPPHFSTKHNWTTAAESNSTGGMREKGQSNGSGRVSGNSVSSSSRMKNSLIHPGYLNDMFRALLNLVNAYTKDSQVLDCIWSLYCQDLDKTAGNQGLYGIAARINSIGLRLIMDQKITLRSIIDYDALPCTKMFPKKCQLDKLTEALNQAQKANETSSS